MYWLEKWSLGVARDAELSLLTNTSQRTWENLVVRQENLRQWPGRRPLIYSLIIKVHTHTHLHIGQTKFQVG